MLYQNDIYILKGKHIKMRDKILEIIKTKPKHYTRIIESDTLLSTWVRQNTLIVSDHLPSNIRSALYQESNICPNGNVKQLKRINVGFQGCGPAAKCVCTKENISKNVSISKSQTSDINKKNANKKRSHTMISKYGVEYNSQRTELKHIWCSPKITDEQFNLLSDHNWLNQEYNIKKRNASDIANEIGVYYSTVIDYCLRHGFTIRSHSNYSLVEVDISKFINDLGFQTVCNDRKLLSGLELDILIPEKNIAIEINGLYWHAYHPHKSVKEDRLRHYRKSVSCKEKNILLLHITDWEWINRRQAVENILMSKLGINTKIPARKTTIKVVSKKEEQNFLNSFHLKGYCGSHTNIGLFHNDDLVGLATFKKSRFNKSNDSELIRLCFKPGITVVGGVSKMLCHSGYKRVLSYSENDLGFSDSLSKSGFMKLSESKPGYFWTDGSQIISRYKTQKNKLAKLLLEKYDPNLSESQNMFNAGFKRYWNTGNSVWCWNSL